MDRWVQEGCLDQLELEVGVEGEASEDLLDPVDRWESLAHLEDEVYQAMMDLLVQRDKMETGASQDLLDPKEKEGMLEGLEPQASKVSEDSRAEEE